MALENERLKWVIKNQLVSDESRANGMGGVDGDRLAKSIALIKDGFGLPVAPPAGTVFNASFLPDAEIRKVPV